MINLQIPGMPTAMPDSVPDRGQELAMLKSLPFDELMDRIVHSMVEFAINLAIAIVVFYVGRLIITKLYKVVSGVFARRSIDRSLAVFVLSMVRIVLYFILIVTVIGILGINTTSFIAIFASAGVAVGMALSGTLQNFAGGVLILLLKPYKIGDYIEAQGYAGTVREIQIFHTIINTPDNKVIIIPNGGLSTGSLNNWSREDYRRVDWIVSISYGDNIAEAREKILAILASDGRVVERYLEDDRERHAAAIAEQAAATDSAEEQQAEEKAPRGIARIFHRRRKAVKEALREAAKPMANPFAESRVDRAPGVWVSALAASSVDLKVSAWTRSENYWGVYYSVNERILAELPSENIHFPFPQLDVHLSPGE